MSIPTQEGASLDLAKSALQQGRFSEAIEHASAMTGADSANFAAWQILGAAHANAGNAPAAIDAFSQCTRLQPASAPAHFNLAKALLASDDKSQAAVELQSCLSLDPNYQKAKDALQQLNPGAMLSGGLASQPSAPTAWGPPPTLGAAPAGSYAPGRMAAPFGSAPAGAQPAAQPPSYGQPAAFGQYGAPPTQQGSYPSSATLIGSRPAAPAGLLPATQAWAITSLVLGIFSMGFFSLGILGMMVSPVAGTPMLMVVGLADLIVALMFIVGSAGTLARKGWGRSILMGAAAAAIVMLAIDLLMITTGIGMPATPALMGGPSASFQSGFNTGVHIGALIFDPLKMIYCAILFLHLKSDRVKDTLDG